MEGTFANVIQIISGVFSENNWRIAFLPLPVPITKHAWFATTAIVASAIAIALVFKFLSRHRYFGPEMIISVVDDNSDTAPVEMRLAEAKRNFVFLKHLQSGQETSVKLLLQSGGATYRHRCQIHLNRVFPEGHLNIQHWLALRMQLPETGSSSPLKALVDVQPPSWWASTFGNPDRSISSQWIVGAALGVIFLFAQTAVELVMTK